MSKRKCGIIVRSGKGTVKSNGSFTDAIESICRTVSHHVGWESIPYKGKRYQLFGGIRTDLFINLNNPLRGRR